MPDAQSPAPSPLSLLSHHHFNLDDFIHHEHITAAQLVALARDPELADALRAVSTLTTQLDLLHLQSLNRQAVTRLAEVMNSDNPIESRRAAAHITRLTTAATTTSTRLEITRLTTTNRLELATLRAQTPRRRAAVPPPFGAPGPADSSVTSSPTTPIPDTPREPHHQPAPPPNLGAPAPADSSTSPSHASSPTERSEVAPTQALCHSATSPLRPPLLPRLQDDKPPDFLVPFTPVDTFLTTPSLDDTFDQVLMNFLTLIRKCTPEDVSPFEPFFTAYVAGTLNHDRERVKLPIPAFIAHHFRDFMGFKAVRIIRIGDTDAHIGGYHVELPNPDGIVQQSSQAFYADDFSPPNCFHVHPELDHTNNEVHALSNGHPPLRYRILNLKQRWFTPAHSIRFWMCDPMKALSIHLKPP